MSISDNNVVTVSQLVSRLRFLVQREIGEVCVEGEISNFKRQASGHCYFTLKDEMSQMSCAFFRGAASRCNLSLEDGIKVRVVADMEVYVPRGQVQLIVRSVKLAGRGALQEQFEALKAKLMSEGLFDSKRKLDFPRFPFSVGVITSPTGAVIQDICHRFHERAPWIQVYLLPVRVQGDEAASEIAKAICAWNKADFYNLPKVDLLIIGRGGGSMEDLWCFNEEVVARAIADSKIPIISAVGHETDITIADFVADRRVPTPTAAAEFASPEGDVLMSDLDKSLSVMQRVVDHAIQMSELKLDHMGGLFKKDSVDDVFYPFEQMLDELHDEFITKTESRVIQCQIYLNQLAQKLVAYSPQKKWEFSSQIVCSLGKQLARSGVSLLEHFQEVLEHQGDLLKSLGPDSAYKRGFSIVRNAKGDVLTSPKSIKVDEVVSVTMAKGEMMVKKLN